MAVDRYSKLRTSKRRSSLVSPIRPSVGGWKGIAGKLIGITESLRCIDLIVFNLYSGYLTFLRVGYFVLPLHPPKKYDYERNKNIGRVYIIYYTSQ